MSFWIRASAVATLLATSVAAAAPAAPKTIGLVALRPVNASESVVRNANGQLRATLAAITGLEVVDVSLAPGAAPDDLAALRNAAGLADVPRLIAGDVIVHGDAGSVHLLGVSSDPSVRPTIFDQPLPSTRQEELLSAIEAGVCRVLDTYTGATGCQGSIAFDGEVGGDAEVLLDGVSVMSAPFIAELPAPLGAHKIQLRSGTLVSQERRVHVHFETAVRLRLAQQCNQLFVLDQGEEAGCSIALPVDIESTLRTEIVRTVPWTPVVSGGLAVVAVVVGVVFGLQASSDRDARATGAQAGTLSLDEARRLAASQDSNSFRANVLYGVGGVAAGVAVASWVFEF